MLFLRFTRAAVSAVALLALIPVGVGAAAPPACPLIADDAVSAAVASPVHGGIMTDFFTDKPLDTGPDKTVCMWDSDTGATITLSRQTNAFGPGGSPTVAAFAATLMRIPAEAQTELDALRSVGVADIRLPDFQMTSASGIGDAAVWVFQNDPSINVPSGGVIVQRGVDAYAIGVAGLPEGPTRTQAEALAAAVLAMVGGGAPGVQ
jgi:hypothetical protein